MKRIDRLTIAAALVLNARLQQGRPVDADATVEEAYLLAQKLMDWVEEASALEEDE